MLRRSLLATLAIPAVAKAQTPWPTNAVRLVVPYAAGGPTDVAVRILAEALAAPLAARVVVENRTGAGTVVGTDAVAKARDGHSFLVATVAHAVNRAVVAQLPFDPVADFRGVALVGTVPQILLVQRDLPVNDLAGLLTLLRAEPGKHAYGSAGIGSAQHLAAELFRTSAQVQIEHIPYRGAAPAVTDLVAGRLTLVIDSAATALAQLRTGQVKALAVTSPARLPALPNVPAMAELLPGYEAYTWNAVLAPAVMPDAAVARMNAAVNQTLREGRTAARLTELGISVTPDSTPPQVDRFVAGEMAKWSAVLANAGIRPE
ncbi:tripartite tricarboxylate transporter substrate binding protein [Rhodovarius crocodyli]|uniref:Tripartite tricarboxylate transporter substrate binding protein n=1 Tax=Rhodovarius crocodyli TaxID=1979269 RepID=A0A437MJI0_9PROT|nr:tripartite tricarboxylate transporter substrate-binding protein [Rhodovarius crocodyli]RVT97745.1 tripartite tricarboxylate transporter substrate binding protein [Rhodovarius crocodyli]